MVITDKIPARTKGGTGGGARLINTQSLVREPQKDDYDHLPYRSADRHYEADMGRWMSLLENPPAGAPSRGDMTFAAYGKVLQHWLSFRDVVKGHLNGYRTKLSLREKDNILQYTPQKLQIPTGADINKYDVLQWATKDQMQVDLLEYFSLMDNKSPSYGPCQFFMQEIRDVFPDTSKDTTNKIVFADPQLWHLVPGLNEELAQAQVDTIVKRIRPPDELSSILIIANDDINHHIGAVVFPNKAVIATVDPFNVKEKAKLVFDRLFPVFNVVLKSAGQSSKTWKHEVITVPSVPYRSNSPCCGLLAVANGIIVALSLEKSIPFFNHDDLALIAEQLAHRILRKMELKHSWYALIQQFKSNSTDCSLGDSGDNNDGIVDDCQNMDTGEDNDDAGLGDTDINDGTGCDNEGEDEEGDDEDADDADNSDSEKNKSVLGQSSAGGDNMEDEQNVTHIYHEQQHQWFCAIHSLNNLLQAPIFDKCMFDIAAEEVWSKEGKLGCDRLEGDGENGDQNPYLSEVGNYDFSVIDQVLRGTEYSLERVTPDDISTMESDANHALLVMTEKECKHFYAVRTLNGSFWNLNSFGKRPIRMKTNEVTSLCQNSIDLGGQTLKVWQLTPTPTQPTDAIPTELKSTIKTVSWTDQMLHYQYWWSTHFLQEMENTNSYTLSSLDLHCSCTEETGDQVEENISLQGDFVDDTTTLQVVIQHALDHNSHSMNKAASEDYTYVLRTPLLPTIALSRLDHLLLRAAVGEGVANINVDITSVGYIATATNVSDKCNGDECKRHADHVVENTNKKKCVQERSESLMDTQLFSINDDHCCTYLLDRYAGPSHDVLDGSILYRKEGSRYLVKLHEEEEEEEDDNGGKVKGGIDEMYDYNDTKTVLELGKVFQVNPELTKRDTVSEIDIADHISEICQQISNKISGRQQKDTSILSNAILVPATKFVVTDTDPIAFFDHVDTTHESSNVMVRMGVPNDPSHDLIQTLRMHMPENTFDIFMDLISKAKLECKDLAIVAFVSIWTHTNAWKVVNVDDLTFHSFIVIQLPDHPQEDHEMKVIFELTSVEFKNVIPPDRLQQIGSLIFWKQHNSDITVNSLLTRSKHKLRWKAPKESLASIVTLYYSLDKEEHPSKTKYTNVKTAKTKAQSHIIDAIENWVNLSIRRMEEKNFDGGNSIPSTQANQTSASIAQQKLPTNEEGDCSSSHGSNILPEVMILALQQVILAECSIPLSCITHYLCLKKFYVTEFQAWIFQMTEVQLVVDSSQHDKDTEVKQQLSFCLACMHCKERICPSHVSLDEVLCRAPSYMLYHHNLIGIQERKQHPWDEPNWSDLFVSDLEASTDVKQAISEMNKVENQTNFPQCTNISNSFIAKRMILADAIKMDCNNSNVMETRCNSIALSSLCFKGNIHEVIMIGIDKMMKSAFEIKTMKAMGQFGPNSNTLHWLCRLRKFAQTFTKMDVNINMDNLPAHVLDFDTIKRDRPIQITLDKQFGSLTNSIANLPSHESWNDSPLGDDVCQSTFWHTCLDEIFGCGKMSMDLVDENESDEVLNMLSWYYADKIVMVADGLVTAHGGGVNIPEELTEYLDVVKNDNPYFVVLTKVGRYDNKLLLSASSKHRKNLSFFIPTDEFLRFIPKDELLSLQRREKTCYVIQKTIKDKFKKCVREALARDVKEISLHGLFPSTVYRVMVGNAIKPIYVDYDALRNTGELTMYPWYQYRLLPSLAYSSTGLGIRIGAGKKQVKVLTDTREEYGTESRGHNFWFDSRNARSLCVEGAVANWLFAAGLKTQANDIKTWALDKKMSSNQTENANVVLQYMLDRHHIWHQRFVLKYETIFFNDKNVAWLQQVTAPLLLLLKSPCALQAHAIVVWDGFVYDYQEMAPYKVTMPNFRHKNGGELYIMEACYAFFSHMIAKSQTVKSFPSVKLGMEKLETCPFLMPKHKICNVKKLKRKRKRKRSGSR